MKAGYKVKICGTTNLGDALSAAKAGADYFGVVVEVDFSPRSLTIKEAAELFSSPPIPAVALVFHMPEDRLRYLVQKLKPHAVQFLSQEPPELIKRLKQGYPGVEMWQSVHLPQAGETVDITGIKKSIFEYLEAGVDLLLYDTVATVNGRQKYGGTGICSDWSVVKTIMNEIKAGVPVLLAGGINPDNAAAALAEIAPDGIDLCSGVESVPGKKDNDKVIALLNAVRSMEKKGKSI
ncbi:MAG TPA: phosphoribosylanthranilate isomerase [Clostridia bacterium]|nr:phosphoribosylanthranilate isomerase [Clostridia bacterium]